MMAKVGSLKLSMVMESNLLFLNCVLMPSYFQQYSNMAKYPNFSSFPLETGQQQGAQKSNLERKPATQLSGHREHLMPPKGPTPAVSSVEPYQRRGSFVRPPAFFQPPLCLLVRLPSTQRHARVFAGKIPTSTHVNSSSRQSRHPTTVSQTVWGPTTAVRLVHAALALPVELLQLAAAVSLPPRRTSPSLELLLVAVTTLVVMRAYPPGFE
mmetsp:Transcript_5892/g.14495  ORF Transcript_5892/g.14495 Transcript_5892/m.14495 type:complete len:211 (+) Transcript_5892:2236-2868(+)